MLIFTFVIISIIRESSHEITLQFYARRFWPYDLACRDRKLSDPGRSNSFTIDKSYLKSHSRSIHFSSRFCREYNKVSGSVGNLASERPHFVKTNWQKLHYRRIEKFRLQHKKERNFDDRSLRRSGGGGRGGRDTFDNTIIFLLVIGDDVIMRYRYVSGLIARIARCK